jgi:hypothetical protein
VTRAEVSDDSREPRRRRNLRGVGMSCCPHPRSRAVFGGEDDPHAFLRTVSLGGFGEPLEKRVFEPAQLYPAVAAVCPVGLRPDRKTSAPRRL